MGDTDMHTEPTTATAAAPAAAAAAADPVAVLSHNLHHNLALLNQAVTLLEPRLTARALRSLAPIRNYVNSDPEPRKQALAHVLRTSQYYSQGSDRQLRLVAALGNPEPVQPAPAAHNDKGMDVDAESTPAQDAAAATPAASTSQPAASKKGTSTSSKKSSDPNALPKEVASNLPEADAYLSLLVLLTLLDSAPTAVSSATGTAQEYAAKEIEYFAQMNRRTMDQLASKFYFYWVRAHELAGDDSAALRPTLLAAQRTAALRRDDDLQATLLPLLLRNYLDHGLYEQADRLVGKTQFPEASAQNNQLARWYYYLGPYPAL
ncbi:hypothetical protein JCM8202_003761 [Rhodotorula sphaerocarpa]